MAADIEKKRILVIDDDPEVCEALAKRLEQDDFVVRSALSGERGLVIALDEKPDLILLDILMPGVDGWELLRRLRHDEWGSTVKVMVLTNVSDTEGAAIALELNVYDYIVKTDWKLDDVVAKVKERLAEGKN
mgnify:CR=1 FL=1